MAITLSIIVPCYNEEATLETCISRVLEIADATLALDVVIVDDCSRDRSIAIAEAIAAAHPAVRLIKHTHNQGKGAALRTGFAHAMGDVVTIQDADLEYDPQDLRRMLVPIIEGKADAVLGSRFQGHSVRKVMYFWHTVANKLLTFASNIFTNLNFTDIETCYKMFRREVIQQITIEENRFGADPEMVAKLARVTINGQHARIYEVGINYHGRSYAEGKKIGLKDAFRAVYCIVKYGLFR